MHLTREFRTAACAAALLLAGTLAVRAQDSTAPAVEPPSAAAPAPRPEPPRNPDEVVARVAGEPVYERDVEAARRQFQGELAQVPEEQQRSVLIDAIVNMKVLAKAATDAGVDKTPEFEARLDFLRLQALRDAYVEAEVVGKLTPADIEKGYQEMVVAQHTPEEEVHARHILVETKEEAEKVIGELKTGASFEELAKQSKDPSGQNGGDLGFFGKGAMVPPFEAAVFALEPGKITETPVESEFGWHVIKLEEKRMSQPQPLAEVEEQLRNFLMRQRFEALMGELKDKYPVEVVGLPAAPAEAEPAGDAEAAPTNGEAGNAPPEEPANNPESGEQPPN